MTKNFLCRFFGFVRLFFAKFLNVSKGSPLIFFLFCKTMDVQKLPRSPFYIFCHYATYRRPKKISKKFQKNWNFFQFFPQAATVEENTWHIGVLLQFLSLRYGADLGRSRLVCINATQRMTLLSYLLDRKCAFSKNWKKTFLFCISSSENFDSFRRSLCTGNHEEEKFLHTSGVCAYDIFERYPSSNFSWK